MRQPPRKPRQGWAGHKAHSIEKAAEQPPFISTIEFGLSCTVQSPRKHPYMHVVASARHKNGLSFLSTGKLCAEG